MQETDTGLMAALEYRSDLFHDSSMQDLLAHFSHVLQQLMAQPELPLAKLNWLTPAQQANIHAWNQPELHAEQSQLTLSQTAFEFISAPERFARQVQATPNAIALSYCQHHDLSASYQPAYAQHLSYGALWQKVSQLAGWIQSQLAENCLEAPIAVVMNRGTAANPFDLIITTLAILHCGAVYVPISPTLPAKRIRYQLECAGV